jgi:RNA polymerase sigma factor (sigma-70 family)
MPLLLADPELLRRFRDGQREGLEHVYRFYVVGIDRYIRGLAQVTGHPELAQPCAVADLLQEVFVRAFSRTARQNYDGVRAYGPYLKTIARNCVLDRQREQRREVLKNPHELAAMLEDCVRAPDHAADPTQLATLARYTADLPAALRSVYEQRFVLGRSQREVSTSLGMTRRSVRTAESHLRRTLRRALGPFVRA